MINRTPAKASGGTPSKAILIAGVFPPQRMLRMIAAIAALTVIV
jgi:hypothetical protein